MAIEIVSFPINSMVDLSIVFCKRLPGRVTPIFMKGIPHQLTHPMLRKKSPKFISNRGGACQLLSWVSQILAPLAQI